MGFGNANAGIDPGIDPGTGVDQVFQSAGPSPTITGISPQSAIVGGASFLLTITGTYFTADTTVTFGADGPITPVILGGTVLLVPIQAADIASAGTITVTITNAGGSAITSFSVVAQTPWLPPLQSVMESNGPFTCGDTGTPYEAILQANGSPVNLSSVVSGYLHIQYANGALALSLPVVIADQTVPANIGLVTVSGFASNLTRASNCRHEVRLEMSDGTFRTFKGAEPLTTQLPYSTP